jgi:hypothetical protein
MSEQAAPERTLAIVFGASRWPHAPGLANAASFAASAHEFAGYLTDPGGFALPASNLLNLFDHEISQADLRQIMRKFISGRRKVLEDKGEAPGDVIIYYAGHAGFSADGELFLAVRSTADGDAFESSVKASALSRLLVEECAGLRAHVILDCRFADPGPADQIRAQLPEADTALLWSASANAPDDATPTPFTGALLDVLREGGAAQDAQFSLHSLREVVERRIDANVADQVARPMLYCPDPGPRVPLFNNRAHPPR